MGSIKKNLTFTIAVSVCVLVFAVGAYMAFAESSMISKAKQSISGAEAQLNNFRYADPAPTEDNVIASEKNLADLDAELQKIREVLQRGARITTSTDGIGVTAAIQQYISEYQRKAERFTYTDTEGEEQPIQLPNNFGFGFESYLGEQETLDNSETTARLDRQRQVLSYLIDKLYESKPHSLVSVKREILENKSGEPAKNGFQVGEAITSEVPGAIDAMGFSISFTGYTASLRNFLNQLRKFDLPIVVRSIEVSRPSGLSVVEAPTDGALDNIFAGFGGGGESTSSAEPAKAQKAVVSQNVSTFTVVLEFIQVILPADKNV